MLISVQNLSEFWGKQRRKIATPVVSITGFLPENSGVLHTDIIAEIRRRHFVSGESISSIARSLKISRPTV